MGTILYILSILLKIGIIPVSVLIYRKKLNITNGLFLGTFLFIASFCVSVMYSNISYGISIIDSTVNGVFAEFLNSVREIYTGDLFYAVESAVGSLKDIYFAMLPSIIVASNLVSAYFAIMIIRLILKIFRKDVSGFGYFSDFAMSKAGILICAVSFILFDVVKNTRIGFAFLNLSAIIMFAAVICGISYIDFKFKNKVKFFVLRWFIYIVSFFVLNAMMGFGTVLLLFIGSADALFDLRKSKIKPGEPKSM